MNTTIEEKITHLEHQNEVIIKLLKETQSHLRNKSGEKPASISLENIVLQETQATNYVNNVIMPALKKRETEQVEGMIEAKS